MKKIRTAIAICIIPFLYCSTAWSQLTDSGYINLGRIRLKNDFTQTFSIKPEYIQRMPFTNITEALAPWFYGNFTNTATVMYIVDGNIAPDINVYSILDIAEITLVQNALVQLNGATSQAQLVVIKTKRNKDGKTGVAASGQLFLVRNLQKDQTTGIRYPSDVNVYHRYDISAYYNTGKMQYGASVNFQRDVFPSIHADSIHTTTPDNLSRFRLNAYLNWQVWKNSELTLNVNYTPQDIKFGQEQVYPISQGNTSSVTENLNQPEKLFTPWARLYSSFSNHWSNDFIASYSLFDEKNNTHTTTSYFFPLSSPSYVTVSSNDVIKEKIGFLSFSDQVRYKAHLNNWLMESSVDFQYSYLKSSDIETGYTSSSSYDFTFKNKGHIFLLTPSFTASYKNLFSVQTGLLENLSAAKSANHTTTFPFVASSLDLFSLSGYSGRNKLKLYGSYAASGYFMDPNFPLTDFYYSSTLNNLNFGGPTVIIGSGNIYVPSQTKYNTWIIEGGLDWITAGGRLRLNYNFEKRAFNATIEFVTLFGIGISEPIVQSNTQRLSSSVKIIEKKDFEWLSTLTIANININKGIPPYFTREYATGDFNTSKPSFTGGLLNRASYKAFSFGMDLMYHFSEQVFTALTNYPNPAGQRINSILLQNIYAGYHFKKMEIYVAARNLFQSSSSVLMDINRYYGLGFHAVIL